MVRRAGSPDDPDDAFEAFFRREFASISRTAYLIVGDWEVAREISQDTFVQVLRHWEKVKDMESPGGWARRVAIRRAVRSRRRATHGRALENATVPTLVGEPSLTGLDVHRALLALPRRQRAAIALHYFEDRPVSEIATLLGCGEVTVRTHLPRGERQWPNVWERTSPMSLDERVRVGLRRSADTGRLDEDEVFDQIRTAYERGVVRARVLRQATTVAIVLTLIAGIGVFVSFRAAPDRYRTTSAVALSTGVPGFAGDPLAIAQGTRRAALHAADVAPSGGQIRLEATRSGKNRLALAVTSPSRAESALVTRKWVATMTPALKTYATRELIRREQRDQHQIQGAVRRATPRRPEADETGTGHLPRVAQV